MISDDPSGPNDPNGQNDTTYTPTDDTAKHQQAKSPAVTGEEDVFSGDATTSESPDIDEELEKMGLHGDEEGIKPLGVAGELQDEEE